jgi:hypothetical protein
VVGGATAVLTPRPLAALGVLAAVLAAYFAAHDSLPNLSLWWDVAFIALLVIPAVFAPVWILLPLYGWKWRWLAILVCIALAVVFSVLGWEGPASFSKLGAATFAGWLFLDFFEEASWIVLVALIIPWVDAYSVWRGPTHTIVHHHAGVFEHLSFAFPVPGESGTANLGIPDMLFFALFLAATARFRLRTALTWVLMTASFGTTIALAVWLDLGGLPALPLLALGFLVANVDLLWREVRRSRRRNEQQNAPGRPSRSSE